MLADVNVKRVIITTVIVVLTVAVMYAVCIAVWTFVAGQYLKKNLIDGRMIGAEILTPKDPPAPKVRRPVVDPESEPSGSSEEGTESNAPSNSPPKVYQSTETQSDDTRVREVNPSHTHNPVPNEPDVRPLPYLLNFIVISRVSIPVFGLSMGRYDNGRFINNIPPFYLSNSS